MTIRGPSAAPGAAPAPGILDLDGSVASQRNLVRTYAPRIADVRGHGPRIRLTCSHGAFRRFMSDVDTALPHDPDRPAVVLAGADVVGDGSSVVVEGLVRRLSHRWEHPAVAGGDVAADSRDAASRNERANVALLEAFGVRPRVPDVDVRRAQAGD